MSELTANRRLSSNWCGCCCPASKTFGTVRFLSQAEIDVLCAANRTNSLTCKMSVVVVNSLYILSCARNSLSIFPYGGRSHAFGYIACAVLNCYAGKSCINASCQLGAKCNTPALLSTFRKEAKQTTRNAVQPARRLCKKASGNSAVAVSSVSVATSTQHISPKQCHFSVWGKLE